MSPGLEQVPTLVKKGGATGSEDTQGQVKQISLLDSTPPEKSTLDTIAVLTPTILSSEMNISQERQPTIPLWDEGELSGDNVLDAHREAVAGSQLRSPGVNQSQPTGLATSPRSPGFDLSRPETVALLASETNQLQFLDRY